MPDQALSGLRVLDLTRYVAGPYCTKLLADHGAEVIKIERPGVGDEARHMGPFFKDDPHPEKSASFFYLNTNKSSITLNLKTTTGKRMFKELVKQSDIVVENFSPRVIPGLGLSYETLQEINPSLIMTSISNFGQTGPYRDYKANDLSIHAISGWMYSVGEPAREPLKAGGMIALYVAGIYAAISTLAALNHRDRTSAGQHLDVSIMECWMLNQIFPTVNYSYSGMIIPRNGNFFPGITECKDGYVGVNILTEAQWETVCLLLEMPEILEDPRFSDGVKRRIAEKELKEAAKPYMEKLKDRTKEEIFHAAQELRIPAGIVSTVEDLVNSPQNKAREYFVTADTAEGPATFPKAPFHMSDTPWQLKNCAPRLSEHNVEIYGKLLGYDRQDLTKLREQGVI